MTLPFLWIVKSSQTKVSQLDLTSKTHKRKEVTEIKNKRRATQMLKQIQLFLPNVFKEKLRCSSGV